MTDPFYKDFSAPGLRLITQGEEMARTRKWIDYTSLGLTHAHIPELIRIVQEIDAFFGIDASLHQMSTPQSMPGAFWDNSKLKKPSFR